MAAAITSPLIGRVDELDAFGAAFAAGRHILVEGPHGVGKSLFVARICAVSGKPLVVVHGSAALNAGALTGAHDPNVVLRAGYQRTAFVPGPLVEAMVGGRVLYLDDANRVPADVLNALISSMSEGELVVPRYGLVRASSGFRVVAAVNPLDVIGTTTLPAAFLDRVVRLTLDYQSAADERAIVLAQLPDADPALVSRAVYAVRASRRHPDVRIGSSVRGAIDLVAIAACLAQLVPEGADLEAALLALSSKIVLRSDVERTVESVIRDLWADAVINEHRATTGARRDSAVDEPLPPSSVELDRDSEGEGDGETDRPGDVASDRDASGSATPERGANGPPSAGTGGRGVPGADPAHGPESEVTAQTRQALVAFVRSSGRWSGRRRTQVTPSPDLTDIERLAAAVVVNRVQGQLPATDRTGGRFATVRYNFRSDDLDLDRTIAELVETPALTASQMWVHDRVPRRRGVVLMVDVSGSMRGDQAIESATAAAAAALAAEHDELAVVAFGTGAEVLKRSEETVGVPELARRVLSLRPHGLTDLSAGLEAGLGLLATMQSAVKIAVIMTDGVQNQGADARLAAARYRQLNVLATTESPWRLRHCQALAAAGRGRCLRYERLDRLPAAISVLLSG